MVGRMQRYRQIARVLARNGLYATATQAGLGRWLPDAAGDLDAADEIGPELLAKTFEELGTTFIKLGQLISVRADLFPQAYCTAFSRLTDGTTSVPFEELDDVVREDLGAPLAELLAWVDPTPLASASIGQVHRAQLTDGRSVVVKIRKPGVAEEVHTDLEIMANLAGHLARNSQLFADLDVITLVEEFSRSLRAELDYLTEARTAAEFAEHLSDSPDVHVPWVEWSMTTSRVLTMEELSGLRIDDVPGLEAAGIDREDLARRAVTGLMRLMFEEGVFHADPHAGNLFVEPGGTIGLVDFGMVGRLSPEMRRQFARMFVALYARDSDGLTTALLEIAPPRGSLDRDRLRAEVARLTGWLDGRALADIRVDAVTDQLLGIVRRHRLALPPEAVQLFRMLVIVDGLGRTIYPDFDLTEVVDPYARHLIEEQLSPRQLAGRVRDATLAAAELGLDLPAYARRLLQRLDSGGVDVNIRASELEPLVARLERTGDRMVAAMVVAAMIMGGTRMLVAYHDRLGRFSGALVGAGGASLTVGSAYLAWTGRPRPRDLRPPRT